MPHDKSFAVLIRPSSYSGTIGLNVFDGEKIIGHCYGQTYFYYECEPGVHIFASALENNAFMKATLLPGRIYYVRIAPLFGMAQLRTLIFPVYPGGSDWG